MLWGIKENERKTKGIAEIYEKVPDIPTEIDPTLMAAASIPRKLWNDPAPTVIADSRQPQPDVYIASIEPPIMPPTIQPQVFVEPKLVSSPPATPEQPLAFAYPVEQRIIKRKPRIFRVIQASVRHSTPANLSLSQTIRIPQNSGIVPTKLLTNRTNRRIRAFRSIQ